MCIGAAILCRLVLPPLPSPHRARLSWPTLGGLWRPRMRGALLLGAFGQAVLIGLPFTMMPLYGTSHLHLSPPAIAIALSFLAVVNVTTMSLAGLIADRRGRLPALVPALVWGALVLGLASQAGNLTLFVVVCAAIGVTVGSISVVPAAMVIDLATERVPSISGFRIGADVGQFAGAIGAGALIGAAGPPGAFLIAAGALILGALLALAVGETRPSLPARLPA
jgi:MFS family permease